MGPRIWIGMVSRSAGFTAAWAAFALALTLASRLMGWGPGFSNPLPYAALAFALCGAGQLVRLWLGESSAPAAPSAGAAGGSSAGPLRLVVLLGREFRRGALIFLRGPSACNNFLLLTLTYVIGIGLSSLFVRNPGKRRPRGNRSGPGAAEAPAETYWQDLNLGRQEADAYYRPF